MQRSYGDQSVEVDWGFFTDDTEAAIVKPKVLAAEYKKIFGNEAYILDDGEYINLLIGSKVDPEFCAQVLGHETFSDYALSISSGISSFQPVETEASQILFNLLEQIRYEKGGTAGAYSPIRVYVEGDLNIPAAVYDPCIVEDAIDKNTEFPY